jgi:hypothetical protein
MWLKPMAEAAAWGLEDSCNVFRKPDEVPFIFWSNSLVTDLLCNAVIFISAILLVQYCSTLFD